MGSGDAGAGSGTGTAGTGSKSGSGYGGRPQLLSSTVEALLDHEQAHSCSLQALQALCRGQLPMLRRRLTSTTQAPQVGPPASCLSWQGSCCTPTGHLPQRLWQGAVGLLLLLLRCYRAVLSLPSAFFKAAARGTSSTCRMLSSGHA